MEVILPKQPQLGQLINQIEHALYAFIAARLCTYFTYDLNLPLPLSLIAAFIVTVGFIGATAVGIKLYNKLKHILVQSPPFAATAVILIFTIIIILKLQANSLFAFSLLLGMYCRMVKGIAIKNYKLSYKFTYWSVISIAIGFFAASKFPTLHNASQLSANSWRFPYLIATILSLREILYHNIVLPAIRHLKHIYQTQTNLSLKSQNPLKSFFCWAEAILICAFLIIELEIGGFYWLKSIVATNDSSGIVAFIISITIFILALGVFTSKKISTSNLLAWGFIGPTITTPLHFMIGSHSDVLMAITGQGFFMLFVAATAAGTIQRLGQLFPSRIKLTAISCCWLLSFTSIAIFIHFYKHNLLIQPMWIIAFVGAILWLVLQGKIIRKQHSYL